MEHVDKIQANGPELVQTSSHDTYIKSVIIILLSVIVLGLLYKFVFSPPEEDTKVIQDQTDQKSDLERIGERQDDYKAQHPYASDEEVNQAFKQGIQNLEEWKNNYKKDHPDASEADIERARKQARSQ